MTPEVIDAPGWCGPGGHTESTASGIRALTSRSTSWRLITRSAAAHCHDDALARFSWEPVSTAGGCPPEREAGVAMSSPASGGLHEGETTEHRRTS